MFQLKCYTYDTAFWLTPSLLIQDLWPWNGSDVMSLVPSLCYTLTFLSPSYYVYYQPAFLSTGLSWTCPLSRYLAAMSHYATSLTPSYSLSRYLAAMSHYATSLTPSYSVQTFSRVRFILSRSYLWLPFIVLLTRHSLLPPHLWYFAYWRVTLLCTYVFIPRTLTCLLYLWHVSFTLLV